jgi:hypothetical protein
MHGSLIASQRRSSKSSNEPGVLSSTEHMPTDDRCTEIHQPIDHHIKSTATIGGRVTPTLTIDMKKSPSLETDINITPPSTADTKLLSGCPADVIEYDDDQKEPSTPVTHSADFFRWTHGHRRVMLTFGTICLFAFMTGVEYAVILPTAFDYVKTMTPVNIYVGLILSSYSISGSIAGVIMGKISDVTGKVKILILVSNIFEIGGNILYFVTNNIHIVLLGRLIAGVGMGAVPPVRIRFI